MNQFEQRTQQFLRLQNLILQRIENFTFNLVDNDLGDLIKENDGIVKELIELKSGFEQKCKNINNQSITECMLNIKEQLRATNQIVFTGNNEIDLSSLMNILKEVKDLKGQKQEQLNYLHSQFKQYHTKLLDYESELVFHNQEIEELNDRNNCLCKQMDDLKGENQNDYDLFKEKMQTRYQAISNQIEDFQQSLQKFERFNQNILQEIQTKYLQQIDMLNKDFTGCLDNSIQRNPLHYILLLDQSDKFNSEYPRAVNDIITFLQQLQPFDYLQIISFSEQAQIICEKKNISTLDLNALKVTLNAHFDGKAYSSSNAFSQLKDLLDQTLYTNEFPIFILFNDGQECRTFSDVIEKTLSQVQDMDFYTINYGFQFNAEQLQRITKQFNQSQNIPQQKKNGQTKQLQLNEQNPLKLDNNSVNLSNNNQLNAEEIEKAIQFIEERFNFQIKLQEEFYVKQKLMLEQKIENCVQEELKLKESDLSQKSFQDDIKKQLEEINKNKHTLKLKIREQQNCCSKIQTKILFLKDDFCSQFFKFEDYVIMSIPQKNEEIQSLYQKKINQVSQEFDLLIQQANEKIEKIKGTELTEMLNNDNLQIIQDLGFSTIIQYYTFQELYENATVIQLCIITMKQKYSLIIEQLVDICKMVKNGMQFSKQNIINMTKSNLQDRVLEFYSKFDDSINIIQINKAKRKIISLSNSLIWDQCKESGKDKLYHKCINTLEFDTLLKLAEQDNKLQQKIILQEIVPQIIRYDNKLSCVQNQIQTLTRKIEQNQEQIDEIKEDSTYGDNPKLEKQIEALLIEKQRLKEQLEYSKENEQNLLGQFLDQNVDDISIIKEIASTFIEAIKTAKRQMEYEYSVTPFKHYLSATQQIIKQFKNYEYPSLLGSTDSSINN